MIKLIKLLKHSSSFIHIHPIHPKQCLTTADGRKNHQGRRVLCIAKKDLDPNDVPKAEAFLASIESILNLLGNLKKKLRTK